MQPAIIPSTHEQRSSTSAPSPTLSEPAPIREHLYFLDNLRVVLVIGVIAHHVGQAYGQIGGDWPFQDAADAAVLEPFFIVNRSFAMSLFFMMAGYFTVMSLDARGIRAFLNNRLHRLGIPLLLFALCMIPLQLFVFPPARGESPSAFPINVLHMWFVEHLLIFSVGYALWRWLRPQRILAQPDQRNPPGYIAILLFALVVAALTALVRIWYPIDDWVYLLGFIRVAFADVPRDLSFFIVGTLAYHYGWLRSFPTKAGIIWLLVGLSAAALCYAVVLLDLPVSESAATIIYPVWELLLCCGLCIGLTVLFRERFNIQGRLGKELARSQFAVYIFHLPIVLLCQYLLFGIDLAPFTKFVVGTLICVPLSFLLSAWIRKPLRIG